jgi:AhpD family alkylhydroperoxidase
MTTPHIPPLEPDAAPAAVLPVLRAIAAKQGEVHPFLRTLAHAPPVLRAYLALAQGLAAGQLSSREQELIALAVAAANCCAPCLALHTQRGTAAGLSLAALAWARGEVADVPPALSAREAAVVALARALVHARGPLPSDALSALQAQGLGAALWLEVGAQVGLNQLSNTLNHLSGA